MAATKLQIGYEDYDDSGKRVLRLTPLDQVIKLSSEAENIISTLIMFIDNSEPAGPNHGDGEADIPVSDAVVKKLVEAIHQEKLLAFIPKDANIFIRLKHQN